VIVRIWDWLRWSHPFLCTCIDTCIDWSGSVRSHDGWLDGWFVLIELCVVYFLFVRSLVRFALLWMFLNSKEQRIGLID